MTKRALALTFILSLTLAGTAFASPDRYQRQSERCVADEFLGESGGYNRRPDAVSCPDSPCETVIENDAEGLDGANDDGYSFYDEFDHPEPAPVENNHPEPAPETPDSEQISMKDGMVCVTASGTAPCRMDNVSFDVVIKETGLASEDDALAVLRSVKQILVKDHVSHDNMAVTKSVTSVSYVYEEAGLSNRRPHHYTTTIVLHVKDVFLAELPQYAVDCVAAGALEVTNARAYSLYYEEAYQNALSRACHEARERAAAMAEGSGMTLGKCVLTELDSAVAVPFLDVTSYIDNTLDTTDWTDSVTVTVNSAFVME